MRVEAARDHRHRQSERRNRQDNDRGLGCACSPTELGEVRQGIPAWEAGVLVLIDPKPECMLKYLFEAVWKIQPVRRDHPHNDPRHWVDEPPAAGLIRTHCKICRDFIGYRPDRKAERSSQQ